MPPTGPHSFTLTFCESAVGEVNTTAIGTRAENGMHIDHMARIQAELGLTGVESDLYLLHSLSFHDSRPPTGVTVPEAGILVIRDGVNALTQRPDALSGCHGELRDMVSKNLFDSQRMIRGSVKTMHARTTNVLADHTQKPDLATLKSTVVDIKDFPALDNLRRVLSGWSDFDGLLVAETNHYPDSFKCGIGWHGDAERKHVLGARVGPGAVNMPLRFQAFYRHEPVGCEVRVEIKSGDVFVLSEKATGYDWRSSSFLTWRHAAGADTCQYVKPKLTKAEKESVAEAREEKKRKLE